MQLQSPQMAMMICQTNWPSQVAAVAPSSKGMLSDNPSSQIELPGNNMHSSNTPPLEPVVEGIQKSDKTKSNNLEFEGNGVLREETEMSVDETDDDVVDASDIKTNETGSHGWQKVGTAVLVFLLPLFAAAVACQGSDSSLAVCKPVLEGIQFQIFAAAVFALKAAASIATITFGLAVLYLSAQWLFWFLGDFLFTAGLVVLLIQLGMHWSPICWTFIPVLLLIRTVMAYARFFYQLWRLMKWCTSPIWSLVAWLTRPIRRLVAWTTRPLWLSLAWFTRPIRRLLIWLTGPVWRLASWATARTSPRP